MAQVNVGKVTLIPKGEYNAATTYARLDFVVHNGTSWVSRQDGNKGHTPAVGSQYWQLLASAAEEVTIESQEYTYAAQNATDFTGQPPTSGWQSSIPVVGAGNYLWTKIETTYSDGNTFSAYIPAKYGTNGTGAGTVTGLKLGATGSAINPDSDGIVILPIDATPTEGSNNLVTSGGVLARIYNAVSNLVTLATFNAHANNTNIHVNTTEKAEWAGKAAASIARTITIATGDWSGKTCTKAVSGVTASKNIVVAPAPASFLAYGAAQIRATAQGSGTVTFTCEETPTGSISVIILIVG